MSLPKLRANGAYRQKRTRSNGTTYRHGGEDWLMKVGTPVGAPVSGTATVKNDPNGFGLYVSIVDARNEEYIVAHLSQAFASVGKRKKVGAAHLVGKAGKSGNASGLPAKEHHVHLERRVKGKSAAPSYVHLLNMYHPR